MTVRDRAVRGFLLVALLAHSAGAPRSALAHGALKASAPASGAHLRVAPVEIRLTFTENVERPFTRIVLVGPDADTVSLGQFVIASATPREVAARITGRLRPGVFAIHWQVAGRDGHPVRGTVQFTIAPGASGLPSDSAAMPPVHHSPTSFPDAGTRNTFDASSPMFAVARWLTLLAAIITIGAVVFRFAVVSRLSRAGDSAGLELVEPVLARAASLGLAAAGALMLAAVGRLMAQSLAMHGSADAFNFAAIGSMLAGTLWGNAWLLQVVAALVAVVSFAAVRRGAFSAWRVVAIAAPLVALSLSLSGHAAAMSRFTSVGIAVDALHVIGAAGWLGSLLMVIAAGIPATRKLAGPQRPAALAQLVNAFSPTALIFSGLAASTGTFNAWMHLGRVNALWTSPYGRTLLLKLGVLSLVVATGAYNWLRVRPALGNELGERRLRRAASLELAVGAAVLAVTAVLVATRTPME